MTRTLFLVLLLCAAPCLALAQAEDVNPMFAELAKAPAKAANRRNPLEHDPNATRAGAKLFHQHCAECHGERALGGRKGPTLWADEVQHASPGALFWVLTNGVVRQGMPVWSKLPEAQRWQLVSYIKSLSASREPVPRSASKAP